MEGYSFGYQYITTVLNSTKTKDKTAGNNNLRQKYRRTKSLSAIKICWSFVKLHDN